MDWNHDGDEDYSDGLVTGLFVSGPWWLSLGIVVGSLLIWWLN